MCRQCNDPKPLADFYEHPQMADGHLNICKECVKANVNRHRGANLERIRVYDRARGREIERRKKAAVYQKTKGREISKAAKQRWVERNPEKIHAIWTASNAVRDGKLKRQPCEVCGTTVDVEKHHDDYSKPLEVRWLCTKHHGETRRKF